MSIVSLKELYLADLSTLYDAESQMLRAIPRYIELARAPQLREALEKHWLESRLHLDRLELIFTHRGERMVPRVCVGLKGIVQEADDLVNQPQTRNARDAAIIGAIQRLEHYEIASYGCVRMHARRLNRPDEARLLQETLDEESRADRLLTEIAESHLSDDARSERDLHQRRQSQLGFVPANQLDYSQLSREGLEVRSSEGDDLGAFDGLLVDIASRRPSYVVVATGEVFGGPKYLLQVMSVRFDGPTRTLRVDLDRGGTGRYPAFDPDQFAAMSAEQAQRYEHDLPALFPQPPAGPPPQAEVLPEWLAGITTLASRGRTRRETRTERPKAADRRS